MKFAQKRIAKKLLVFLFLISGLLFARLLLAADFGTDVVNNGLGGSLGKSGTDPRTIIANIINIALGFLGVIAIGLIIYAGVLWMTSNGDEDKVDRAKQILRNGIIGLAIILASWIIVTFLINKFGGAINGTSGNGRGCTSGETQSCGCGGSMVCANGLWSSCVGGSLANCANPPTSCDSSLLPGCQAASQICAAGYYCDNSCLCQTKANLGDSCDADTTNLTCNPDNTRCSEYLTCDPNSCLCIGPPVITSMSPLGGFCNSDNNKACSQDSDCGAGNTCDIITPNGTTNNFITISGKNFGTYSATSSKVIFLGNASGSSLGAPGENDSPVQALSPTTVNPACVSFWRDDQIIIAVPSGVQTGAIEVQNKDNLKDRTDDSVGPKINNFQANKISRPGLCNIDPSKGSLNSQVNYQGVNLYSGKAYFGNYQSNVSALYSTFSDKTGLSGTSTTPNIQAGPSGSFVQTVVAGSLQKSNYLKFIKDKEAGDGPYIMSFTPGSGPAGQYVTIKGLGFGGAKGNSNVYFVSGNNKIPASYTFPAICANSVWSDNEIIIKVPAGIGDDNYQIEIVIGTNDISTKELNPNTFKVNSKSSLKPSLCKMDPSQGSIDTPVTFWGEYFGKAKSDGLVKFNFDKSSNGVIGEEKDGSNTIKATVPSGATTGPVKVVKNSEAGNELNFEVSECKVNADCNDQVCCPQNTYRKGRCVASLDQCFTDIPTSVYEWSFNTNLIASITPTFSSCLGASKYFGSCYQGATCPNSPGACSSPSTATKKIVGTCDITCNNVPGCTINTCTYDNTLDKCVKNKVANSVCDVSDQTTFIRDVNASEKNVPRVMFWQGKVNQHWDLAKGVWSTDSDGRSGATLDKLTYCKKFYPNSVNVIQFKNELTNTWRAAGNTGQYSGTLMSYRCVLADEVDTLSRTCNSAGRWEIKLASSCPIGWTRGLNGICIQDNLTCNPCLDNLSCEKVGQSNACVSAKLCAGKANCVDNTTNAQDDCILDVPPSCECCCRIGYDKQDCCAPLTCAGECGSDVVDHSHTYGSCSGCAAVGKTTAEHDAACNCSNSSGKYCSITSDAPQGICSDCAGIDTQTVCGDHSSACCFDSNKTATTTDDVCRGLDGSSVLNKDKNSVDYGYCAYFACKASDPLICDSNPLKIGLFNKVEKCVSDCPKGGGDVCSSFNGNKDACSNEIGCCYDQTTTKCKTGNAISSSNSSSADYFGYCAYYNCKTNGSLSCDNAPLTVGKFTDLTSCTSGCKNPPAGAGLGCADTASIASSTCNFGLCTFAGFSCLQDNGSTGNYPSCGTCCCQPGTANDFCKAISPVLNCVADQGACSGASRGLCCGCSQDSDCGSLTSTGCGSDTCCQSRPSVSSTMPTMGATNVCRNSVIKITFNEKMDSNSFANNFTLFEEKVYGNGTCPDGTFLTDAREAERLINPSNQNIFTRLWKNISSIVKNIFNKNQVLATPPDDAKLYCAVSGTVGSEETGSQTSLIFTPNRALSPSASYYAVIKGDETLNSQTGVLSSAKIGMNGGGFAEKKFFRTTIFGFLKTVYTNPIKFNHKDYINSYSFKFTTLSEQGGVGGICAIDNVKVSPASYLFNTTDNDLNEKDNSIYNSSFDTVADRDKVFSVNAFSADGQLIHPVPGYNWNWDWSVTNSAVAHISNTPIDLESNRRLIEANSGITDNQTQVTATVNMQGLGNVYNGGDGFNSKGDIYVFVCNNPWPKINPDGTWYPWNDVGGNCSIGGTCEGFNYKFYYCRDAGSAGTLDDLPSINNSPVTRGGSLICSLDSSPCSSVGSTCGSGGKGVCYWNVLKESYFFREAGIDSVQSINATDTGKGGEVKVTWSSVVTSVNSYKIYYLKANKGVMLSETVSAASVCIKNGQTYDCSANVSGLIDGQSYIFKLTTISTNNVESALSGEKTATPTNQTKPLTPAKPIITTTSSTVKFSWTPNVASDNIVFYRLYRGISSGLYGEQFDSANNLTSMTVDIQRFKPTSSLNYFVLSAIRSDKKESDKSGEVVLDLSGK